MVERLSSELPCRRLPALLSEYGLYYGRHLAPRGKRRLERLLEHVEAYLQERGVTSVDLRERAPTGVVRGVASIDAVLTALDDFDERYLVTVGASRELMRVAASTICDLTHWLHQRRVPGRGLVPVSIAPRRPTAPGR